MRTDPISSRTTWLVSGMPILALCLVLTLSTSSSGQSTVVSTGDSSAVVNQHEVYSSRSSQFSISGSSQQIREWEQIFGRRNVALSGGLSIKHLLHSLEQIGLPIHLDQTAIDDSCTLEDRITLGHSSLSLYQQITTGLKNLNASLALVDNQFHICSLDSVSDPEFFCLQFYDVGQFDVEPWELTNLIRNTIAPDSWDDTNGDGVIQVVRTNGLRTLVVSQNYGIQLKIRHFLAQIGGLTNHGSVRLSSPIRRTKVQSDMASGFGSRYMSTPIWVPTADRKRTRRVIQSGSSSSGSNKSGGVF